MIGLSLSLCVAEIISDRVRLEDVELIRANTRAVSEQDWERLMDGYCRIYWRKDPERARRVVRLLRDANRIEQPRIVDPDHQHDIDRGIWENVT